MGKVCIVDLDGTIANCDHRVKYVTGTNKDWDKFYKECVNDTPNWPVIQVLHALYTVGYKIVILSGRSDEVRKETIAWLQNYGINYQGLYMRPDKNYISDDQLKAKMMLDAQQEMGFTKDDVLCILDDRDKVVRMWRDAGYPCFQIKDGSY